MMLSYAVFCCCFFCYEVTSIALNLIPRQMSTQHPYLTTNEKCRRRGLSCIKIADSRAPSMVFGWSRPVLVCRRLYYGCWELCPLSRKGSYSSKWRCTGKDHEIPCQTRFRFDEILATVCSCTKMGQFWLPSLARNHDVDLQATMKTMMQTTNHVLLEFLSNKIDRCWEHVQSTIDSVDNGGNGMRLKWWHFLGSSCIYRYWQRVEIIICIIISCFTAIICNWCALI